MIFMSQIGSNGKLGNQMFQWAALFGISKAHNDEEFVFSPGRLLDIFKITDGINFENYKAEGPKFIYQERSFDFAPECVDPRAIVSGIDFRGYFQSELYWKHSKDKLLKQFTFKKPYKFENEYDFVSVHVRRGDYLQLQNTHPCPTVEWYEEQMNKFENRKFVLFSDDIQWCKSAFSQLDKEIFFVDNVENDFEELSLMTTATDAIIANSSFSWWGAYLGPHQRNGRVIAPKKWFGDAGPKKWDSIYCVGWEIA